MKTAKLFITLLIGAVILFSSCNNDDEPITYTIDVSNGGNGTAEADMRTAEVGAIVQLTATAAKGYVFEKWTIESGIITLSPNAMTNPVTFIMPAENVSVKAEFTVDQSLYTIYLAGFYENAAFDRFAFTMTNGVRTDLLPSTGESDASPSSMAVSDGKTYVSGGYFDSDGWSRACYWVNGVFTELDGPAGRGEDQTEYAESIIVSDGRVYTAGFYMNNYESVPCYWLDGMLKTLILPEGANSGIVRSIAASDGKIYAAGSYFKNNVRVPGYWCDDIFESLSIPNGASFAASNINIVVSDKIYMMGNYRLNLKSIPCYWVDGVRTDLTFDESSNGGAVGTAMVVSDGKVYVTGYSIADNFYKACYWTDGARTDLDIPAGHSSLARSVGIINKKVYVGGAINTVYHNYKPCYWFDGVRTDLTVPTGGTQAQITSIHISE